MPVVLAPLPNVAVHVAEAKRVGNAKVIYWGRLVAKLSFGTISIDIVAVMVNYFSR